MTRAHTPASSCSRTVPPASATWRGICCGPRFPWPKPQAPAPQRTEVAIDPALLDLYAGRYEPGPGAVFVITREGDALMLQLPGLPKLRLRPESPRAFFVAENTRVTVIFEVDSAGRAVRLMLGSPTGDVPAQRLDDR